MSSLWQNLIIILEQEIFLYEKLLNEVIAQKKHIASGYIDGINETGKTENTLSLKLKIIAETRLRLVKKIAFENHIDTKDSDLIKIIAVSEEPYISKLRQNYRILKEIAGSIKIINKSNYLFFSHSMQQIQTSLGLLVNTKPEYTEDGMLNTSHNINAGYVDNKY